MTNTTDKVKRISSRRRPNMREMQRQLGPGYYGGVPGLRNSAID